MITWTLWRRVAFRFFFLFIVLSIAPWTWLGELPLISNLMNYYYDGFEALSLQFNDWFFHVPRPKVPVQNNGSGDTSGSWAVLYTTLLIAMVGAIIWSLAQRRKKEYLRLNYWLCLLTRYFIIATSFTYGIIKLFGLQMPFPNYSQLATPLGDFLPMRFSWMFLGYSSPYQAFSGMAEVLAGLLLLYRRTATLGAIVAAAVFINVAALNLSYDIPVKIFSLQMVFYCLFLLANESHRILCFFWYNRPANACQLYVYPLPKRWMRIGRVVLKIIFVVWAFGLVFYDSIGRKADRQAETKGMVFKAGMYNVSQFAALRDTAASLPDSLQWKDVIFDTKTGGSIATADTAFRRRYGRSYFVYQVDTSLQTLALFKTMADQQPIVKFNYRFLDAQRIALNGRRGVDSLSLVLQQSPHSFPLAERQFHWISEANR